MLGVRESLPESIVRIWKNNASIRAEFGKFSTFAAFMEAGPAVERDKIIQDNPPGKVVSSIEAECAGEWLGDARIREQYKSLDAYTAARKAMAKAPAPDESKIASEAASEWLASAKLREEFQNLAQYTAYKKAAASGFVRVRGV